MDPKIYHLSSSIHLTSTTVMTDLRHPAIPSWVFHSAIHSPLFQAQPAGGFTGKHIHNYWNNWPSLIVFSSQRWCVCSLSGSWLGVCQADRRIRPYTLRSSVGDLASRTICTPRPVIKQIQPRMWSPYQCQNEANHLKHLKGLWQVTTVFW